MKVIVCGAGVAGLTLAAKLSAAGWKVVLVDSRKGVGERSYVVDLFGKGYEAAARMGILGRLCEKQCRCSEVVWVDERGAAVARLDRGRLEQMLGGQVVTLLRSDLETVLYDSLPRSVETRFDARIEEIHLPGSGVRAHFASGQTEHADLLIGADGMHSRVRNLMLGDSEYAFHFMGFHMAAFVFDDADIARRLEGRCKVLTVPNRQVRFSPLGGTRVAALFAHRGESTAIPSEPLKELNRIYRPLGWLVPAALERADSQACIHYDYLGQVHLRRWSFGRVVLVGDACQSSSPLTEDGATFAMYGGEVLAEELLRNSLLEDALARYEAKVKPMAEDRQLVGLRAARWLLPASSWRMHMRNLLLRIGNHRGMSWVLKPVLV